MQSRPVDRTLANDPDIGVPEQTLGHLSRDPDHLSWRPLQAGAAHGVPLLTGFWPMYLTGTRCGSGASR